MNLNRIGSYVLLGLLAICALGWGITAWRKGRVEDERTRAEVQRDSLAGDAFAARQEAAGWEVAFGDRDPALLQERLEQLDSALAVDAAASRVRIESLTRLLAEARAHVEGGADTEYMPTYAGVSPDAVPPLPDSVRGPLNDGLLEAVWTFRYGPRTVGLDYTVLTPIDLFGSTAGDGRTIIGARSPDPRVRVSVTEYVVAAQEVREVRSCSIGQRAVMLGIGAGVGFIGGRFVP